MYLDECPQLMNRNYVISLITRMADSKTVKGQWKKSKLKTALRLDYGYRRLVHTGCAFSLISLLFIPAN